MAGKLILTVGIPGSGKSTWAQELRRTSPPGSVRVVERDELRTLLFTDAYHRGTPDNKSENQVTALQEKLVEEGLRAGATVIVSDTHVEPRRVRPWVEKAQAAGAECAFEYFDVAPEECKRRNSARGAAGGREVPAFIMDAMIAKGYGEDGHIKEYKVSPSNGSVSFVPRSTRGMKQVEKFNREMEARHPFSGKAVVLVDVDGTLANNAHHASYFLHGPQRRKKDFPGFYKAIEEAEVNTAVVDLAHRMKQEEGMSIVVLTGRDDRYARELLNFVRRSGLQASRLYCKRDGDFRPDRDYKHEVLEDLKREGFIPVHALDDREGSIATMRAHGITVSQVAVPLVTLPEDGSFPTEAPPMPAVTTTYGDGHCIRCGSKLKKGNIGRRCATQLSLP